MVLLGTGTDVGKTYFGRLLAASYVAQGGSCLALKPVESGVAEVALDAAGLRAAASLGSEPCYSFSPPISPHLAARQVGVTLDLDEIYAFVERWESRLVEDLPTPRLSLVETAGGAFSPLSDETVNFDLAQRLDPAIFVLVCPDALGVLHDIGAALRAMHQRLPDILVFCEAREADASTGTNPTEFLKVVLPQVQKALSVPDWFPSVVRVPRGGSVQSVGVQVLEALSEVAAAFESR